jgi:hypothetical protein
MDSKQFLTAHDIAKLLSISYVNALNFIKYSNINYIKIGNQYRVATDVFQKFTHSKGNIIVNLD